MLPLKIPPTHVSHTLKFSNICLTWFLHRESIITTLMSCSLSLIMKSRIYKNANIFPLTRFNCWTQDVSRCTVKSIFRVCVLEASSVHVIPVFAEYLTGIVFQTVCDYTNHDRWSAPFNQISYEHRNNLHFHQSL